MPAQRVPPDEFIQLFQSIGPTALAKRLNTSERVVHGRRASLERQHGITIAGPKNNTRIATNHPHRIQAEINNGVVLVGSDAHVWPGPLSTAFRAFIKFTKDLKPQIAVMNGDVFDGATISRHPPIGWETRPTVIEEIEACTAALHEIELAAGRKTRLIWPLGNHDARFETRLAMAAPEYAMVHGVHLKDHFGPRWEPCWSVWINDVVVKHRFKGGIHATHNSTMWAGKTMVTGHLHSLKVTPYTDYNGTRYGVDTGTLTDPFGPQFVHYSEDNPRNHRSGFIVLTFHNGKLLWPEVVAVLDEKHVEFRGQVISV